MGKLGVNLELFDLDAPTFHVHKDRIGELVRKFKDAQRMGNSEDAIDYIEKPEQITRLNSKQENNNLVEDAFKRLSEKQKIFCSKQINNFIKEVSKDKFVVQLNSVKESSANKNKNDRWY